MADSITLFDVGMLSLLLTWILCWVVQDNPGPKTRPLIALCAIASIGCTLAALIWRGLLAQHFPLITTYEFALAFIVASMLAYTIVGWRFGWSPLGRTTLLVPLALSAYARWGIPATKQTIQPLIPALQSPWLPFHVITAAIAYGFFVVAFGSAILAFTLPARDEGDKTNDIHDNPTDHNSGGEPNIPALQQMMHTAVWWGYLALSASMITGAIWAQMAWGHYWQWDPKEVWALVTWLIYTVFLHARYQRGWRGRPLAGLALLGFAAVLFTFLGVGPLARWTAVQSLHVF